MEDGIQDWIYQCSFPDGTELQEHTLKTGNTIIVGDRCTIDYGLKGKDVVVCEFTTLNGGIYADGDVRIDNWCEVNGDVIAAGDAYLGEGVKIHGKLFVQGDLDVGDNVHIERGFEAKGWISIRNPMPVIAYLILYVMTLLKMDNPDEIDGALKEIFGGDEDDEDENPLLIPPSSTIDMKVFSVPTMMTIGNCCRLHGNIKAASVVTGRDNTIFGSLRAGGLIRVGDGTQVHGNVEGGDEVAVAPGVHILGNVTGRTLALDENARVDGTIRAPEGIRFEREVQEEA
ncbi:polymer-forming cytoskeletal protein [uncultured Methanofollis sp.]|uniref:polymer-forming cytoskeletal protein n=1 Tax=uncultured Methanofollis sp. TaxID=262500 RepID=UPI002633189F|nr:polymer-forming cytoskeletal protein [uncultured Methanofollis sp.]